MIKAVYRINALTRRSRRFHRCRPFGFSASEIRQVAQVVSVDVVRVSAQVLLSPSAGPHPDILSSHPLILRVAAHRDECRPIVLDTHDYILPGEIVLCTRHSAAPVIHTTPHLRDGSVKGVRRVNAVVCPFRHIVLVSAGLSALGSLARPAIDRPLRGTLRTRNPRSARPTRRCGRNKYFHPPGTRRGDAPDVHELLRHHSVLTGGAPSLDRSAERDG